jgi:hypothetical protein
MNLPGFTADSSLYTTKSHYRIAPNNSVNSRVALPQLQKDDWTTDKVCTACGCTVSGFVCNCGLRPSPDKLACIRNGGPQKPAAIFNTIGRRA